jgi:hypothetical protein
MIETKLFIRIQSPPFEENPCSICKGKGWYGSPRALDPTCEYCQGIGKRHVRLVGDVEVDTWFNTGEIHVVEWKDGSAYVGRKVFEDKESAVEGIIAAYHAGTLPESLLQSPENPTGLRLEEME